MANLVAGQLYIPETAQEILDDYVMDFDLECKSLGITLPATQPGTENWFFFKTMANAGLLQYANIGTIRPALTPLTADGPDLETWREALGLPVVEPSPAAGKLTVKVAAGQTITVPNNQRFTLPNGLRGHVSGTHLGLVDGSDVAVVMDDRGAASNATADTIARFSNAPFGLDTEARVSRSSPLTGGFDTESEARKRERVLNRLATSPGGGNWGQLRELAFNALATVQDAYVYPALGGPASEKVVIVREFDADRNDYHRAMTDAAVTLVRDAVQKQNSGSIELVVDTVAEEVSNVAFLIDIPDSSLSGGNGLGWIDQSPWPQPSATTVAVTAVTSPTQITFGVVDNGLSTIINGITNIAWWSPHDQKFRTALVLTSSDASGTWTVTLDTPFIDGDGNSVAAGDYISPPSVNMNGYGKTFLKLMGALGAGENVTPAAADIPRRFRHPFISDGAQIGITGKFLADFVRSHQEIEDGEFSAVSKVTPTVPASVDSPPNILIPNHFAVYPTQ